MLEESHVKTCQLQSRENKRDLLVSDLNDEATLTLVDE
jgi:hypothetical protein